MFIKNKDILTSVSPSPGVAAVKDSVPLSPLKSSAGSADAEQQSTEAGNSASGNDLQPRVSMETSNLRPQTPKAEHELEEDDEASGTLTISELTYRSINLYNKLSKAAFLNYKSLNSCFRLNDHFLAHVFGVNSKDGCVFDGCSCRFLERKLQIQPIFSSKGQILEFLTF